MGRIYFDVMKDDMFVDSNSRFDAYDSDVDDPDPDLFYRIINAPVPNFGEMREKLLHMVDPGFGRSYGQVIREKFGRKMFWTMLTGALAIAGIGIYVCQVDPNLLSSLLW